MVFKKGISSIAGFFFLALGLVACGGGGGGGGGSVSIGESGGGAVVAADTGTVTLLATDAETDQFSEINLTVIRAELFPEEGGDRVLLYEGEKTFNLLALADVTEVFSVTEVPEGVYTKLRLTLTEIELVFYEDRPPEYPRLPGNGKLDLIPRGAWPVDADNPLTIEMDFDAEKSIQIVEAGDKFNFRPVVFTKRVESEYDTKLILQTGEVREFDEVAGTFDLCLLDIPSEGPDCVSVDAADRPATVFNAMAEPVSLDAISNGAIVTVAGRFRYGSDDLQGVSEPGEAELFAKESGEQEPGGEVPGVDRPGKGGPPEDIPAGGRPQDEDSSDDDSSDDDSSDDDSSDDDSSDDDSSEDDSSEDDSDNGEGADSPVLVAELIWLGDEITRTENIACSEAAEAAEGGLAFDNAQVPLADGENCETASRPTLIGPDTLLYDREGHALDPSVIRADLINVVYGYMLPEDEGGALRALLIIFDLEESDEERVELRGTIGEVETESLTLQTDVGDRCVLFEEGDTDVFESVEVEGSLEFNQRDVDSLASGQLASVFGEANSEGCAEADNIIYQNPAP